jgi:hypothetical protein
MENHRLFTRIPFEATAQLVNKKDNRTWECRLLDISLKGILVSEPQGWQGNLDELFLVTLTLDNSDVEIRMEVSTAHIEQHHIGFRCEHIDLDSITHLRRLVELNVGDTQILNRELSALGR